MTLTIIDASAVRKELAQAATDEKIAELAAKFMPLVIEDVNDSEALAVVHTARMEIKDLRVGVEKKRKELKAEALEYGRTVDGEAKRIKAQLEPIEAHLQSEEDKVKAEQERIAAEAEAKKRAELQKKLDLLTELGKPTHPDIVLAMSDEQFDELVKIANKEFDERQAAEEARKAEEEAARKKAEEEARIEREKIEAERKELEELRRKQAEQQAVERAKLEAERKAEAERQAKIEAEARAKREAEQAEIDKQRAELEKAQAAERAKVEAREAKKRKAAEEKRRKELAPDREKVIGVADTIRQIELPELSEGAAPDTLLPIIANTLEEAAEKVVMIAESLK